MYQCDEFKVDNGVKGSDHAPITIRLNMKEIRPYIINALLERSQCLGVATYEQDSITIPKSINYHQVCTVTFLNLLTEMNPPVIPCEGLDNITETIKTTEGMIMHAANKCKKAQKQLVRDHVSYWERLLLLNDSKSLWQAIDWKGEYNSQKPNSSPTDIAFKRHFESLLNGGRHLDAHEMVRSAQNSPYILILDVFEPAELEDAVRKLKSNKGYIGIAPGLIKCLPIPWLMFTLGIFNLLFQFCPYPVHGSISKLITIFKSGESLLCGNYRGISIPNTLAKLYDIMLYERLIKWCKFSNIFC